MSCPDCGAENPPAHTTCHRCGTVLPTPHKIDEPQRAPKWKRHLTLWGILLALVGIPCLFMADLFCTPKDVVLSRRSFDALRRSYYARPATWGAKKEAVCSWIEARNGGAEITWEEGAIPLEVFMAYLVERLDLSPTELKDVSLYPGEDPDRKRLILSKHEKGFTPIPIILSLEMELEMVEGQIAPSFISLKRGSREVPTALAWVYFGPELQLLGCLKPIAEEVKRIQAADAPAVSPSSLKR